MTNHEAAHRVPEGTTPAPRISLALSAEQARAVATGSAGGSSAVLPASQDCAAPGRSGPVVYLAVRDAADEAGDLPGVQVLGVFDREDDARMVRGAERVEAHPVHTGPPACTAAAPARDRGGHQTHPTDHEEDPMARYTVTATGAANFTTTVEADSPQEAVQNVTDDGPGLCHHCSNPRRGTEVEIGDDWRAVAVYDEHGTPRAPEVES